MWHGEYQQFLKLGTRTNAATDYQLAPFNFGGFIMPGKLSGSSASCGGILA